MEEFELHGEEYVRESVRLNRFTHAKHEAAKQWLKQKEAERRSIEDGNISAAKSAQNAG